METTVLCVANSYNKKYYLNDRFNSLPQRIKNELKIECVWFTEEVGGILEILYEGDSTLYFRTSSEENDILYDEIGSGLKIKQLQNDKREFWKNLEDYYKLVILKELD